MAGPAGGRRPVREEMAHRVAADEHHGAIAIELAPRIPQRLRLRDWDDGDQGKRNRIETALSQVLDPSRGLNLRTGHQHLHGAVFQWAPAARSRAATAVPSSPACARSAATA